MSNALGTALGNLGSDSASENTTRYTYSTHKLVNAVNSGNAPSGKSGTAVIWLLLKYLQ